jgi:flavin-dependent dehydrogenase
MIELCDVAVVGGGPAGAACALELSRSGLSVAILERTDLSAQRIGEALRPDAMPQLQALGVWDAFARDGHRACPGNLTVWADSTTRENDFICHPYGNGWHVERVLFDRTLLAIRPHARRSGPRRDGGSTTNSQVTGGNSRRSGSSTRQGVRRRSLVATVLRVSSTIG